MRRLPPLMSEHPRAVQILLVVVVPAVYGFICGVILGVSEGWYLILSAIGIVGGVAAGFDHFGAKSGARRGIAAGSIFGGFILIGHEIAGTDPKADLPKPGILLIVITTVLAIAFAAFGGWLRERAERNRPVEHTAPEIPGPLG
jgi:hypothetical protein